jgi:outer membrane lipoprotein-sorting protein
MPSFWSRFFALAGLVVTLALSGCATKLPQTTPLHADQQQEADGLFSSFVQRQKPRALDADIRIGWDVLGSKGTVDAILQLQQPAYLRFSATDPLGRALYIAVSDGITFTMVDSRIGRVYQGKTGSKFWHTHVPEALTAEDLFYFLSGTLPQGDPKAVSTAQDSQQAGFWYIWKDGRAMVHQVLLARQTREMVRHLLFDPQGDLVLEVAYSSYRGVQENGFNWPRHLQITGKAITGTLTVQIEKIHSHQQLSATAFQLTLPPHYTVEQVP